MTGTSVVVQQHAEESSFLWTTRAVLLRSPHVQLHRLRRLDERIAAHLDGLMVAGEAGCQALDALLASPDAGLVFALMVLSLQTRDASRLTRLVAIAGALPDVQRGMLSALGWVSSEDLQGTVRALLGSKVPLHRAWALAACAMHRVDPGQVLSQAVNDADALVRERAWRVAGMLGRRDLADAARQALLARHDQAGQPSLDEHATLVIGSHAGGLSEDGASALHGAQRAAAWALTLWGEGGNELVRSLLIKALPGQALPDEAAHRLAILAAPLDWGRDQVRSWAALAETSAPCKRRMMRLAAWVGDPQIIPWLIHHMADDVWARLAGEVFSLITGADLTALELERATPDSIDAGPDADPENDHVALDEDDNLPWPDEAKVQAWWRGNASRWVSGQRYVAGQVPSASHALHILQTAGQRQRTMAAEYLCLLRPGSKLFPVAAPAWRQSRWLAEEEAALS